MSASLPFILGLLDRSFPAFAAYEDFRGEHGQALRLWQRRGFLATASERHPIPGCPCCGEGVPYRIGERYLCNCCFSTVDPRHLQRWRFDLEAFLTWLARALRLKGGVRQVDEWLWQMGSYQQGGLLQECFFCRTGPLSEPARRRLLAYRNAVVLQAVPRRENLACVHGRCVTLLELLQQNRRSLKAADLDTMLRPHGAVRFEEGSGAVFVGDANLGEVPPGSKEYHFLLALASQQDTFIAYADLKRAVLEQTGSCDTTEEATFCQKLKSRIKRGIPQIDRLVATTGKGDGYRLRAFARVGADP